MKRARSRVAPLIAAVAFAYLLFVSVKLASLGGVHPAAVSRPTTATACDPLPRAGAPRSRRWGCCRRVQTHHRGDPQAPRSWWMQEEVGPAGQLLRARAHGRRGVGARRQGVGGGLRVHRRRGLHRLGRRRGDQVPQLARPRQRRGRDGRVPAVGAGVGSAVTVVGTARAEYVEALELSGASNGTVVVVQFAVELRGLRAADGEEPPRIFHLNPHLRGDWSQRPVLEMNTCFRMQWGIAQRCDGTPSKDDDHVDEFKKCEKWERRDTVDSKETKTSSWLNRFIGRAKKPEMRLPYPFSEGKMFILTIQAGIEGYRINVGGRHVASFPHRMGLTLDDATGLAVTGGIDVHSVYATARPRAHPSFSLQQVLEMSDRWKARPVLVS